ncbi:MAG TPA: BatD family protein [Gemmatimonadales bacterium]|nr:BatD family protein [Gemmatimonadales bacterium]
MLPLLAVAVLVQGAEVTAGVDRTHLRVGEELMLTIRARSRAADPVEIVVPSLTGFAIVGSRDMTEVALGGASGSIRTTVRELQLRAQQPGALLIGPIRARQGGSVVSTDPILVTVDSAADRTTSTLSPLARSLLESTPPPVSRRSDRVALTMLVPSDTVYAGQQVDIIAAAWIPRDLGERMRRPPLLTLVTPEGVWAYPAATPSGGGAALSRQVNGRWMDLFIAHQVAFPLVPGRLIIPPASVEYALPVTFSFFSREERYTLRSDSIGITVLPLPPANPATTVVAESLSLDLRVDPATTRVGEPIEAAVTISGIGNVALWPEPPLKWPAGFRVYPAQTEVRVATDAGRIAGSKMFQFLAVPDSSGNFVLPEMRYLYFNVRAGRYQTASAAPRALAVAPGAEPRAARVLPPLLPAHGELPAETLSRRLGWQGWLAVLAAPPLVAGLAWRRRRRAPAPVVVSQGAGGGAGGSPELTPLGRLEREFLAVLASYVSDPFARDGDGLAQALRAAGVDSAVSDHVKRLRDRLRAARYGPRGLGDAAELAAEIEQVLHVLGAASDGHGHRGGRRPRPTFASVLLAIATLGGQHAASLHSQTVPATTAAQTPSAEALFEAGALRAAADSFAARAAREPREPANWYNLGATLYRAGADGKATAAWTRAARLAPRDPAIRRALRLLPAPDPVTEQLLRVGWATPAEWGVIAATGWLLLWLVIAFGSRRRVVIALFGAVAVGASILGALEWRRREQAVAVVIADAAPVRAAPYGGASAAATVQAGGALLVGRSYGPWVEVHRNDGIHGWVLGGEISGL